MFGGDGEGENCRWCVLWWGGLCFFGPYIGCKNSFKQYTFLGIFFLFQKIPAKNPGFWPFIVSKHLFKKSTFLGSTAVSSMASMSMIFRDKYFNYSISYKRYSLLGGESFSTPQWAISWSPCHQHFSHNVFNNFAKMIHFWIPCNLQLKKHSPYKEPLDHLINRAHEVDLTAYWCASTFGDMLRTKRITIIST